jgi:succinate dehydrogenase/fumarate reductase flavoprotein subunit
MNPLAIELYRMHGHDLARDPLPFNVNNQHMNGGVAVDAWNESSLADCYAIGEVAGTHGVTRPGGAALNAGQVGGLRCAEQVRSRGHALPAAALPAAAAPQVAEALALIERALAGRDGLEVAAVKAEVQARMSDQAGFICRGDEVAGALDQARRLRSEVFARGFACRRASQAVDVFRWRHLALTSEAVLTALARYVAQGGGSRGARAYLSPQGAKVPHGREGALEEYRFLEERVEHRAHKLVLRWDDAGFALEERPLRTLEDLGRIFFEKNWGHFLTGDHYRAGFVHR